MKKKLSIYDYFWVFFAGSFIGVIIEEFYWLIKTGLLESRQGLVYGPFNLVYGFGALLLTLALNSFKKNNKINFKIFIVSFIIGSLFEYFCSIFQEEVFGTVSWEYSKKALNINGRITLQYSVFWGFLGIIWIRYLLPSFVRLINEVPVKVNHILTIICLVFMIVNSIVTFAVSYRQTERFNNEAPSNKIEQYIDKRYPDQVMNKIFPNSKRVEIRQ